MWGDALVIGVFHSEIEMDCNGIVWESLGLWEGLENGDCESFTLHTKYCA